MPKTKSHKELAERMSEARTLSSSQVMSRAQFLAQTPKELRVSSKSKTVLRSQISKASVSRLGVVSEYWDPFHYHGRTDPRDGVFVNVRLRPSAPDSQAFV